MINPKATQIHIINFSMQKSYRNQNKIRMRSCKFSGYRLCILECNLCLEFAGPLGEDFPTMFHHPHSIRVVRSRLPTLTWLKESGR